MVIGFSVKEAREQLLNKGTVYTFRWKRRAFFAKEKGTIEHTWANKGRGKPSIGNVQIEEVRETDVNLDDLDPYYPQSGFESSMDWQGKIMLMLPYPGCDDGWIYKVTLKSSEVRRHEI